MPSTKALRKRIGSVRSTQQITKAMKMVAAAKLRRAQDSAERARPYAEKLSEMLQAVAAGVDAEASPLLARREERKVDVLVLTSDRGLCGGFNANILRLAETVIRKEGRHRKFVPKLEQVCYNASLGRERGQVALFVTERAVFRVGAKGLELTEIAPGLDAERDVIAHMGFRPLVSRDLKVMDARIFNPARMGLSADIHAKPRGFRSPRVAAWHEARARG